MKNGSVSMADAQGMKSTTSDLRTVSSSENMKEKVSHLHHFMHTESKRDYQTIWYYV